MPRFALQARYVFPVAQAPLPDGVVTIENDAILAVGQNLSGQPPQDLGNVALLPGLINAHTHLELSDLAQPLGSPGMPLPTWIEHVLTHRRAAPNGGGAIQQGIRESLRAGATTLVDIAQPGWSPDQYASPPADLWILKELLGLAPGRVEPLCKSADEHLALTAPPDCDWSFGLSPHAPYSLHPAVLVHAADALPADSLLAMHLAESPEEIELLQTGGGPFAALLQKLQVWQPQLFPGGMRPLDYLKILRRAPRALVIHGNYLDDEELAFMAAHRDRLTLVYCPRTQAYFGHRPYPLARALQWGVRVALGTDSRASSPDLNLLAELRHVARAHPELPLPAVLQLGSASAAEALGRNRLGALAPGQIANLTAVPLPPHDDEPHALLLHSDQPACRTWYRGAEV